MNKKRVMWVVMCTMVMSGCVSDGTPTAGGNAPEIGGERPAAVFVPQVRLDGSSSEPLPLVILLHGFTSDGASHDAYFRLSELVDELDFVLVVPDGEQNMAGIRYWNATANCCDFEARETDDVAYIAGLIEEAQARHPIDRVVLFGHSNGGFLAHSVACQHAELVSGVVSVSASSYTDASSCRPVRPVDVLHAHGTHDEVIWFGGGFLVDDEYPSARALARRWAMTNGCASESLGGLHDEVMLGALDSDVQRDVWSGCDEKRSVEMWSLRGEPHRPDFLGTRFSEIALEHMFARTR